MRNYFVGCSQVVMALLPSLCGGRRVSMKAKTARGSGLGKQIEDTLGRAEAEAGI